MLNKLQNLTKNKSRRGKEINLYERYFYDPEAIARRKELLFGVLPMIILMAIIIVIFAFFKISDAVHNHEINKIQEYIDSPKVQNDYNLSLEKQEELKKQTAIFDKMNSAVEWRKSLPKMDADTLDTIISALSGAKVTSYSYNSEDRTFVVAASTKNATAVPDQVRSLKKTGDFSDVKYTGYEGDDGRYNFTVTCTLY